VSVGRGSPLEQFVAPVAVAACGSVALGFADGGFQDRTWGPAAVTFAAATALILLFRSHAEVSRLEVSVLALLAGFVAWSALSALWSADPPASLREAARGMLYLVALSTMLLAVARVDARGLAFGVLTAATVLSGYGLLEYLVARPEIDPIEGTLLFEPLGYANALGIVAAIGAVLSCGFALRARSFAARALRASPLAILVPTLALTESRGAWAASAIAFIVLVAVGFRFSGRQLVVALTVLVIGASAVAWSSRHDFYGERPTYWHVAWRDYRQHPVLGSGAGTYVLAWGRTLTPSGHIALDAHNLYLETLAEVGPVGLSLLVAALFLPLAGLRRGGDTLVPGAAYLAFLIHAAVDWDWEMPAVTLLGLGCAASLLAGQRPETRRVQISGRSRGVVVAIAAGAATAIFVVARLA
jgi:O-antigen ligase